MSDTVDYEQISYGKATYKRVQRLRRKGQRRGIAVPYLCYELHKPERPRIAFWIVAAVSTVLFIGILVGVGFLYNELAKSLLGLSGLGEAIGALFSPEIFAASAGLSALPGIMLVAAYLLIILLLLLPLCGALLFYSFVYETFYMAKCSKEEFAKGNIISSLIFRFVTVMITATAILIVLLMYIESANAKLYIGLIYGGLMIVIGGLLVLIVIEKVKNGKWFEGLEEDKKQNYLAHDGALRQVKRRLRHERQILDDITRLGR
ncbi:MAG: hypothetical protein K2L12_08440 [Clostridia bacterium]|nr:hypothetical protein [Clostridia bacterium]